MEREGNQPMMTSTELFPDLIWQEVFKKLSNPDDVINCWKLCGNFERLLSAQRVTFLFPKVLPVLLKNHEQDFIAPVNNSEVSDINDAPTATGLLRLRSVCKFWKRGVNNHLKSWSRFLAHWDVDDDFKCQPYNFLQTHELSRFTLEMSPSDTEDDISNPFINGFVRFSDSECSHVRHRNRTRYALYWGTVTSEFMPQLGKHILYLELHIKGLTDQWESKDRDYSVLQRCLRQTPYLRGLTLFGTVGNDTEALAMVINRKPVPSLKYLRFLKFCRCHDEVVGELLRAATSDSKSLEVLDLSFEDYLYPEIEPFIPTLPEEFLSSLEILRLPEIRLLKTLTTLREANLSAITFLSLKVRLASTSKRGDPVSLTKLFQAVTFFGQKNPLRKLHLRLVADTKFLPEPNARLELPLLEVLVLDSSSLVGIYTLDFAVGMKELRKLSVQTSHEIEGAASVEEKNISEIIQFIGYENRMLESNIWVVLPKLEELYLEVNCGDFAYRRRDWY